MGWDFGCAWRRWALLVMGLSMGGKEPRAMLYKWLGGDLSLDRLLRLLLSRLRRQLLAQQGRMRGYPSCSGYDEGMDM